ncbi:hypothetical protein HELRODRAFT_170105 [Helobdella robusta]|uniref:Uncharacterized protein n=1 Tax=Helobdella robusta TaxID=6412 RepID=T1F2M7_HELRO|nr:hypothetical protein HELRODRAFT_170105 [Helobdella robusta]ESO07561.1 hypothetical protein HELRODRAFT_170105 [Helobdella robusta]
MAQKIKTDKTPNRRIRCRWKERCLENKSDNKEKMVLCDSKHELDINSTLYFDKKGDDGSDADDEHVDCSKEIPPRDSTQFNFSKTLFEKDENSKLSKSLVPSNDDSQSFSTIPSNHPLPFDLVIDLEHGHATSSPSRRSNALSSNTSEVANTSKRNSLWERISIPIIIITLIAVLLIISAIIAAAIVATRRCRTRNEGTYKIEETRNYGGYEICTYSKTGLGSNKSLSGKVSGKSNTATSKSHRKDQEWYV